MRARSRPSAQIRSLPKLGQVPLEEIVQKGPYDRNCSQLPDLLPGWCNRRLDDVGRELESETGDEPTSAAHQDLAEPPMCRSGKGRPQPSEKGLGGADGDNDQRHRVDDNDNVFGDEMQPFLHRPLLRSRTGRPLGIRTAAFVRFDSMSVYFPAAAATRRRG